MNKKFSLKFSRMKNKFIIKKKFIIIQNKNGHYMILIL